MTGRPSVKAIQSPLEMDPATEPPLAKLLGNGLTPLVLE
jgi:hypothetical protein